MGGAGGEVGNCADCEVGQVGVMKVVSTFSSGKSQYNTRVLGARKGSPPEMSCAQPTHPQSLQSTQNREEADITKPNENSSYPSRPTAAERSPGQVVG